MCVCVMCVCAMEYLGRNKEHFSFKRLDKNKRSKKRSLSVFGDQNRQNFYFLEVVEQKKSRSSKRKNIDFNSRSVKEFSKVGHLPMRLTSVDATAQTLKLISKYARASVCVCVCVYVCVCVCVRKCLRV